MALVFPRHMPTAAYQREELVDEVFQSQNITGGGDPNVADLAPMLWHGKWSGETRSPEERAALEAWATSLQGGLKTFRGGPCAGIRPLAHRAGWNLNVSGSPFLGVGTLAATATRTNLCPRSQEFDQWTKDTSVTVSTDVILAPDDSLTGDRITAAGVSGRGLYKDVTVSANVTYTASVWVRLGTLAALDLAFRFYDVTNSAVITTGVAYSALVTDSGWTRVSATITTPASCTSLRWYPFYSVSATAGTFYLWGAQVNRGYVAASYIATAGTSVVFTPGANEITISGLPDGLILSVGDWLSFPVSTKQRLFKVTEGGSASGGSLNVGITPSRPPDASNGAAVRLEHPYCDMVLVTPPDRVITNYQMGEFSIEGRQVLIG